MFRNLEAEQARLGYTNTDVAKKLGISRVSYENKKKNGKFTTLEIKSLCKLFKCKFDYLFYTDGEGEEWYSGHWAQTGINHYDIGKPNVWADYR